ncbi:MAG: CapA family protein [Eubacterium sp.]|nr:CapA family protein [Eubacterium sp.]
MKRSCKTNLSLFLILALSMSLCACAADSSAINKSASQNDSYSDSSRSSDTSASGSQADTVSDTSASGAQTDTVSGTAASPVPTDAPVKTPRPTPVIDTVTLSCAGDCTIGTDPAFNYSTSLNAMVERVKDKAYFFKNVQKYFANDDMTIVNFEGTLTNRTTRAIKTFTFKGPPSYIGIIKKGNIEAVAFANNHCRDFGEGSYYDTIDVFKKKDVKYSSYSKTGIYKVIKEDTNTKIKIGMISVNGLESYSAAISQIKSGVQKLRKKKCQIVIMSMHAGTERVYTPTSTQRELAHYAVSQGCDLVLGHHPHVLHGVEKYKGVYIVYSLGNFCFGGNSNPSDKDTMIARPEFTFKN